MWKDLEKTENSNFLKNYFKLGQKSKNMFKIQFYINSEFS